MGSEAGFWGRGCLWKPGSPGILSLSLSLCCSLFLERSRTYQRQSEISSSSHCPSGGDSPVTTAMRPAWTIKPKGVVCACTLTVGLVGTQGSGPLVPTSLVYHMVCVSLFISLLPVTSTSIGVPEGQGCLSQLFLYIQGLDHGVVHNKCSISIC